MSDETMLKLTRACVWVVGILTACNVGLFIYKVVAG